MIDLNVLYDAPSSAPASPAPQDVAPASVLYDATPGPAQHSQAAPSTPSESAPQAPAERQQEEQIQAFYGKPDEVPAVEVPENIKAMREADGARQMYSPQGTYSAVLPDDMWAGDEAVKHIPEPVQRAAISELREMACDMGMAHDDVRALQGIGRRITSEPTEAERIGWREQAVARLNETYGTGAAQAFRDARAFIAQDPRRAGILDAKGLGDHPDTVALVARLARQARMQGKLK